MKNLAVFWLVPLFFLIIANFINGAWFSFTIGYLPGMGLVLLILALLIGALLLLGKNPFSSFNLGAFFVTKQLGSAMKTPGSAVGFKYNFMSKGGRPALSRQTVTKVGSATAKAAKTVAAKVAARVQEKLPQAKRIENIVSLASPKAGGRRSILPQKLLKTAYLTTSIVATGGLAPLIAAIKKQSPFSEYNKIMGKARSQSGQPGLNPSFYPPSKEEIGKASQLGGKMGELYAKELQSLRSKAKEEKDPAKKRELWQQYQKGVNEFARVIADLRNISAIEGNKGTAAVTLAGVIQGANSISDKKILKDVANAVEKKEINLATVAHSVKGLPKSPVTGNHEVEVKYTPNEIDVKKMFENPSLFTQTVLDGMNNSRRAYYGEVTKAAVTSTELQTLESMLNQDPSNQVLQNRYERLKKELDEHVKNLEERSKNGDQQAAVELQGYKKGIELMEQTEVLREAITGAAHQKLLNELAAELEKNPSPQVAEAYNMLQNFVENYESSIQKSEFGHQKIEKYQHGKEVMSAISEEGGSKQLSNAVADPKFAEALFGVKTSFDQKDFDKALKSAFEDVKDLVKPIDNIQIIGNKEAYSAVEADRQAKIDSIKKQFNDVLFATAAQDLANHVSEVNNRIAQGDNEAKLNFAGFSFFLNTENYEKLYKLSKTGKK